VIILDLSGVMYSDSLISPTTKIDENMFRHSTLNCIRSYLMKFRAEYGNLVISCDGRNYWRTEKFPYYKAKRKEGRKTSLLDWKAIFACMDKMRNDLKENFPYPVVQVDEAESDDVIATLVLESDPAEPVLILSPDKDFIQLHVRPNIKQYDPPRKRWIAHPSPQTFLIEHIIKGDADDGIPNILSNDDCFVAKVRQKSITQPRLEELVTRIALNKLGPVERNYHRNKMLIDLCETPEEIRRKILTEYNSQLGKPKNKMFNYMVQNRMKHLLAHLSEF
jgi:hypothetical protein